MSTANMRVVFRADASVDIGTGHIARCLALADVLHARGAQIHFICREHLGNLCDQIASKGYSLFRLPIVLFNDSLGKIISPGLGSTQEQDAIACEKYLLSLEKVDWLIVDHYGIGTTWESALRPFADRIMVIDDLANRSHDCDLLLDQNFYPNSALRYSGIVPATSQKLMGPHYALLRAEFRNAKGELRERNAGIRRILIFFGGIDATNETTKALTAIALIDHFHIDIDVVVGAANPHRTSIEMLCSSMPNAAYHCQISNIAKLIVTADLALGAGGSATWERCFLGLPTLTIVVAENQREVTEAVAKTGAIEYLGVSSKVTSERIAGAVTELLDNPKKLETMCRESLALMGRENFRGAEGVADALYAQSKSI